MPLLRYILLQIPGLALISILLWFLWSKGWVSAITAGLIILALVIKDIIFYPFYKKAMQPGPTDMVTRMHGAEALVRTPLDPEGHVSVRGEIWQARNIGKKPLFPGDRVVIVGHRGLTLYVRSAEE